MKLSIIITIMLLTACASQPLRHEVIHLQDVTVHLVTDYSFYEWQEAKDRRLPGYADNNSIWILMVNGWINDKVLAHEFKHLLNWSRPDLIANPDKESNGKWY